MKTTLDGEIIDDLFHGCAFAAFVELAVACKGVPEVEATRRRAYDLYQQGLDQKSGDHGKTG